MIRRLLALTAALTVLTAPVAAAAPGPEPDGQACAPGTGTTVVVDLNPAEASIRIACAEGEQESVSAALTATGFDPGPTTGLLESLSGVRAAELPDTFWAMYLNTTDGLVGGARGAAWVFANEGIDAGPAPVDTVVSFHLQDWNANPGREPSVPLADLAGGAGAPSAENSPAATTDPGSGAASLSSSSSSSAGGSSTDPATDSEGVSGAIWILATVAVLAVVGGTTLLLIRRRHQH